MADAERSDASDRRGQRPSGGVERPGVAAGSPRPADRDGLPDRYQVRDGDDGRVLRCTEAPGLKVRIERSLSYTEAEARKLGDRTILLDGVGRFAPLLDPERHLYNLDHHEGCLRAFTLATCEQALLVVVKGLDLDKGNWTLYANEPDLDTAFALWVLLNHRRLRELPPARRDAIVPLLRLEGAIDANGFEVAEFCGLPRRTLEEARARLDRLQAHELELKQQGAWSELDLLEYGRELLSRIDRLVYRRDDFHDFTHVAEEYDHVEVGDDRVAVVCRDDAGIYEVEKRLKKVWGDRLGLIALEKEAGHYTVRRTTSLTSIDLDSTYRRLNLFDPAVDGSPPDKRWGGSDEIGGSPRPGGTGLAPRQIAAVIAEVHRRPSMGRRLLRGALALVATALLAALAVLGWWRWPVEGPLAGGDIPPGAGLAGLAGAVLLASWWLGRRMSDGRLWLFGWRWPAGRDWLLLAPLALAGGALGGSWAPAGAASGGGAPLAAAAVALLTAAALEAWFRGLVHGALLLDFEVQTVAGRWFISLPALLSGALYAAVSALACRRLVVGSPIELELGAEVAVVLAAGFAQGLALGMIRERSLSLWPGAVVAWLGAVAVLAARAWVGG